MIKNLAWRADRHTGRSDCGVAAAVTSVVRSRFAVRSTWHHREHLRTPTSHYISAAAADIYIYVYHAFAVSRRRRDAKALSAATYRRYTQRIDKLEYLLRIFIPDDLSRGSRTDFRRTIYRNPWNSIYRSDRMSIDRSCVGDRSVKNCGTL